MTAMQRRINQKAGIEWSDMTTMTKNGTPHFIKITRIVNRCLYTDRTIKHYLMLER